MKTLLILILLLFAAPAIAQTGIFYDATVRGEGVTVYEHEGLVLEEFVDFRTFYFYTYGREECEIERYTIDHRIQREVVAEAIAECPNSIFPPFKPLCDPVVVKVTEQLDEVVTLPAADVACDLDGQRWFFGSDPIDKADDSIGKLYMTHGMDYPTCVPSLLPFEEDVDICAELTVVGTYILRPAEEGGFLMWVESVDDNHTDPLFDRAFEFTTPLVEYPEIEPK